MIPTGSPFRIAVLVSGSGTNLQALIDRVHRRDGIEIAAVASSKRGVQALDRAERAGIDGRVLAASDYADRAERDLAMADWLDERDVELVVLAGYMELLSPAFLERFPGRVVNVHPSLLPAFPGARPIDDQIAYGVKVGGVTVHFVDQGVDSGPIILQEPVQLPINGSRDAVLEQIHAVEHELLPRAVRLIAADAVSIDPDNPRLVHVDERGEQARKAARR